MCVLQWIALAFELSVLYRTHGIQEISQTQTLAVMEGTEIDVFFSIINGGSGILANFEYSVTPALSEKFER